MVDAEEHETISSNVGDLKSSATLENEGFSEHLVITHGDHLLQTIRHLSQKLNLSLDGKVGEHTAFTRKLHVVVNTRTKLTPAKYEAWKMWHEDGLSIQKIANYPGRSAPIKEQTVVDYLLEAVSEGFDINWTRLCDEVGLTDEIFSAIQEAISKVGCKDKLKPIKNELPDDITYAHIKACLVMENCGISPEVIPPSQKKGDTDELPSKASETCSIDTWHAEEPHEVEECGKSMVTYGFAYNNKEMTSLPVTKAEVQELSVGCGDDELCSHKRQKVDCPDGGFTVLEATESSVLNLLQKHDEGLPLFDILEHFNGSKSEAVIDLLSCLERDFMIFKKNNLYWLM
ncbi:werner syndrome ATP-dependent helicase [Citrus sinensis]|uniref:Werner syndrome ATP-dependent helicase n=1 Tax=Citrus sinensis TaxID=2711 RepID=A0ACB8JGP2_CITSI|nr:werner syndrome ATP-dependent helicase [Citrus sinensis]